MMGMNAPYTSEREQSGVPVATFQAVGHRAANCCFIDIECLRLNAYQAASMLGVNRPSIEGLFRLGSAYGLNSMGVHMNFVPILPDRQMLALLQRCDLPVSDIGASDALHFYGCYRDGEVDAVVGLEIHNKLALIRSLAVCPSLRTSGLGGALVNYVEAMASKNGVESLFLLTTTANQFFEQLGYEYCERDQAPEAIKATAQFSDLCPASSHFMRKLL